MAKKNIIDGVPKVAFAPIHDGQFEFTPFPSCLKSVLKHLGYTYSYHYLLGASGAAFRLVWHSRKWEGGNVDIAFMDEDPLKPFRRALEAAGFTYEFLLNGAWAWDSGRKRYLEGFMGTDEETFGAKIIESVDSGKPVIAFGVVGPPEAVIITGYDDGGEILIGWSMFQEHLDPSHDISVGDEDGMNPPAGFEESGYFRQTDWMKRLMGMIVLKEKTEVDLADVYRDTLAWIPAIIQSPTAHEYYTGIRAYDEYANKMSQDDEFTAADMSALSERKMVHYDAMTMIAERGGGAEFVREAAGHAAFAGVRDDLNQAADAFAKAAEQMRGGGRSQGKYGAMRRPKSGPPLIPQSGENLSRI